MIDFINTAAPWIIVGIYAAVSCGIITPVVLIVILLGSKLLGISFTAQVC